MPIIIVVIVLMNWSQAGTEIESVDLPVATWRDEPNADFYQTIIDNSLFAPLGTVLNTKPRPGENLKLITTFTRPRGCDSDS